MPQYQLAILSLYETEILLQKEPNVYLVVSISSSLEKLEFKTAQEILYLSFDDIKEEKSGKFFKLRLATAEDCWLL